MVDPHEILTVGSHNLVAAWKVHQGGPTGVARVVDNLVDCSRLTLVALVDGSAKISEY